MSENSNESQIDLFDLIFMVLKRWYVILFFFVIGVIGSSIYATNLSNVYTSSTTMMVLVDFEEEMTFREFTASQRLFAATYQELAHSDLVLDKVANQAVLGYTPGHLRTMISVSGVNDTYILRVSVHNKNPEHAAIIANTVVEVLIETSDSLSWIEPLSIIDRAEIPQTPSGPNRINYIILGSMVGGFFGLGIVFAWEAFIHKGKHTKQNNS